MAETQFDFTDAVNPFEQDFDFSDAVNPFEAEAAQPKSDASLLRTTGDFAIDFAKGVIGAGESAVGIGDLLTGNAIGAGLAKLGYDPDRTRKILESGYSGERTQELEEVRSAAGFLDTVTATLNNPGVALGTIVESSPNLLGSAGVIRALATRMIGKAGLKVGTKEAADFLRQPENIKRLAQAGAIAEGAQAAGSIQESARQEGRGYTESAPFAVAGGALTALIGRIASKIPGLGDAETAAGTIGMTAGTRGNLKNTIKEMAKGAIQEGVLEEMPQSAQEQVFGNLALGKPWDEGVAEAAGTGLIAGAGMGAGVGVARGFTKDTDPKQAINRILSASSVDEAIAEAEDGLTDSIPFDNTPIFNEKEPTIPGIDIPVAETPADLNAPVPQQADQPPAAGMPSVPFKTPSQFDADIAYQQREADLAAQRERDFRPALEQKGEQEVAAAQEMARQADIAKRFQDAPSPTMGDALLRAYLQPDSKRRVDTEGAKAVQPAQTARAEPAPATETRDVLMASGKPFPSEKVAKMSVAFRSSNDAKVVPVEGGYAVRVPKREAPQQAQKQPTPSVQPATPAVPQAQEPTSAADAEDPNEAIQSLKAEAEKLRDSKDPNGFAQAAKKFKQARDMQVNAIENIMASGKPVALQAGRLTITVTKSTREPGKLQVTTFDESGALGDMTIGSASDIAQAGVSLSSTFLSEEEAQNALAVAARGEAEYQDRLSAQADNNMPRDVTPKVFDRVDIPAPTPSQDDARAPVELTKPSEILDAYAARSKNIDQLRSYAIGRFGREKAKALQGDIQLAWSKKIGASEVGANSSPQQAAQPALNPPNRLPVESVRNQIKAKESTKKKIRGTDSLATAVAKFGGINMEWMQDITGDTRNKLIPRIGTVFTRSGLSPDSMAAKLVEAGFIVGDSYEKVATDKAVRDLYDLLKMELDGGRKRYAFNSEGEGLQLEQEVQAQIQGEIDQAEADIENAYAAIAAMHGEDVANQARWFDQAMREYNESFDGALEYYNEIRILAERGSDNEAIADSAAADSAGSDIPTWQSIVEDGGQQGEAAQESQGNSESRVEARFPNTIQIAERLLSKVDPEIELVQLDDGQFERSMRVFTGTLFGSERAKIERETGVRNGDITLESSETRFLSIQIGGKRPQDANKVRVSDTSYAPAKGSDFQLSQQTPDDIAAQERQRKADEQAAKTAADKERADSMREDFALSGSDRVADVAASRGQTGLFDAPTSATVPSTKREPIAQNTAGPQEIASAKPLSEITITEQYRVEGSDRTAVVSRTAQQALDEIDADIDTIKKLVSCLKNN